jgi:hypothetical protein
MTSTTPYRTNPRAVTMFRADDGSLWPTDEQAVARNTLIAECAAAVAPLKPRPADSFKGYIQQDPAVVATVKKAILDIANRDRAIDPWYDGTVEGAAKVHQHGIVWRVLSENDGPLSRAWFRMVCLDDQCREWEGIRLNPRI